MEQVTATDSGQPTVQQMFTVLLGEIASLRKQNEEQRRELEHLRSDMSLFLERSGLPTQTSRKLQFKHLPLEIREMIWELAVPVRLLAFEGVSQEKHVPSALSVPTVALVCRESRRAVMSRKSVTALTGRSTHLDGPSQLWRLDYIKSAVWTWFTPRKDTLLINPRQFEPYEQHRRNHFMVQAAEHIIIDGCTLWNQYSHSSLDDDDTVTLTRFSTWVKDMVPEPDFTSSTRDPVYNLRTLDFAMTNFSRVDKNYPPNFVRRLFAGDRVRVLDLRDKEAVRGVQSMLEDELSQVMDTDSIYPRYTALEDALGNFAAAANDLFPHVRALSLHALADAYQRASRLSGTNSAVPLPSPFRDGELDMEVTWVKELTKRINIRPVHVLFRAEGMSDSILHRWL